MSVENITRMTLNDAIDLMNKGIETGTDWERLKSLTDQEIEDAVKTDPDAVPLFPSSFWDDSVRISNGHIISCPVSLDVEIINWFQSESQDNYVSHINQVLREYMMKHRKAG